MREDHPERMMILDNSAYEFYVKGEELDLDEYIQVIRDLKPDYYILPDVLMDIKGTLNGVRDFMEKYYNTIDQNSQPMAVVQGDSIASLNNCLMTYYQMGIKNIAIPFHNSFFKDEYELCDGDIAYIFASHNYTEFTKDVRYAAGRCMWVSRNEKMLKNFNKIHFLGSHCPVEKVYHKTLFPNATMDSGYPVKCALYGWELENELFKPDVIIDDFMHRELYQKQIDLIVNNINIFKNY